MSSVFSVASYTIRSALQVKANFSHELKWIFTSCFTIFTNQSLEYGEELNQYSAMITDFLHNCGEAEKGFISSQEWWILSGSVKVQIFLTSLDDNAELIVASNLFQYQVQNADINEYILKLNGTLKLKGVCFGIRNKHLILSSIRPVQGLDPEELEWIIASIAVIADEYDDFLIEKFNL